jgi:hypothetical protein
MPNRDDIERWLAQRDAMAAFKSSQPASQWPVYITVIEAADIIAKRQHRKSEIAVIVGELLAKHKAGTLHIETPGIHSADPWQPPWWTACLVCLDDINKHWPEHGRRGPKPKLREYLHDLMLAALREKLTTPGRLIKDSVEVLRTLYPPPTGRRPHSDIYSAARKAALEQFEVEN